MCHLPPVKCHISPVTCPLSAGHHSNELQLQCKQGPWRFCDSQGNPRLSKYFKKIIQAHVTCHVSQNNCHMEHITFYQHHQPQPQTQLNHSSHILWQPQTAAAAVKVLEGLAPWNKVVGLSDMCDFLTDF